MDTALVTTQAYPVTEVAGGCFCCNFPDLVKALTSLQEQVHPDVILAEPVGSCTDLVATTLRPLAAYHPDRFQIAPLSVLLDPGRDLGMFPDNVDYLFKKQLAEAEIVLLNKCDLLDSTHKQQKLSELASPYSHAQAMSVSALNGEGVAQWLEVSLRQRSSSAVTMDLDYQRYAEAEAALGWLNATGKVLSDSPFSILAWTTELLQKLAILCESHQVPIAHIKAHTSAANRVFKASLTRADFPLAWSLKPSDVESTQVDFILNARANTNPAILEQIVLETVEAAKPHPTSRYYFTHFECFSPLPPKPAYRIAAGADGNLI